MDHTCHVPDSPFQIAAREAAPAVGLVFDLEQDLLTGCSGACVHSARIGRQDLPPPNVNSACAMVLSSPGFEVCFSKERTRQHHSMAAGAFQQLIAVVIEDRIEGFSGIIPASQESGTRFAVHSAAKLMQTPLVPGTRLRHYEVQAPLGSGGMGVVYRAMDTRLNRVVAIKVLPPGSALDPTRIRRFEQEARSASALNHPNILTVYDFGEVDGMHYIATEVVEGETLRKLIEADIELNESVRIASEVASALAAAHAAGIVHRDIKPENIMIRRDGYVKILDFGLAKLTEKPVHSPTETDETLAMSMTQAGSVLGTFSYMSPEQARGVAIDARTDVWSLGVVLYEMVSGRAPFRGDTQADTIVSILQKEPPQLTCRQHGPVPEEILRITSKALEKKASDRYQTVADLGVDLRRLLHRLDVDAEIGKLPVAPVRAPAPRKTSAAVLLAVACAVLLATVSGWYAMRSSAPAPSSVRPVAVPAAAPVRTVTIWLTVQRIRDGKPVGEPFEASAQDVFESGWKFRLHAISPQQGSLYLFNNDAASTSGAPLAVLFPPAPGWQGQTVDTGWYIFDSKPGAENCWVIWSSRPIAGLDDIVGRVMNAANKGLVTDGRDLQAIQSYLAAHQTHKSGSKFVLTGSADVVAGLIGLQHR